MRKWSTMVLASCFTWLALVSGVVAAEGPKFAAPSYETVQKQASDWATKQPNVTAETQQAIQQIWNTVDQNASAQELLDATIATFALVNPDVDLFVKDCELTINPKLVPEAKVLDAQSDEFVNANLRLFFARYLSRGRMYDEALEQFSQIDPRNVIDPATSLFYTAVAQQQLLMKTEGLATLDKLLTHTEDVPVRYSSVAKLMQFELQNLRQDSLDEIAAKMKDVGRRLDLGRGGHKVQKKEAEIIASLDYLIEKLEQQQGSCSGSCPCNGNGPSKKNQSSSPAKDSSIKGATAPGNADRKRVANRSGWGALPEKEQAAAKQHAEDNFPPHYRKIIEEYSKRMSERGRK